MPADLVYADGTYTAPFAVSLPELSAPFPRVNLDYVLTQNWVCNLANYTPAALDTAHPDYAAFLLVREDNKRDLLGGKVQWTRTYAKVPASWEDAATINFTFPGSNFAVGAVAVRNPFARTVVARVLYEYFLCSDGQTYPTPKEIPVIPVFQPYLSAWGVHSYTNILRMPLDAEGVTVPTPVEYVAKIGAMPGIVDANGAFVNEIVGQDSSVAQWMGNIYVRETRYIKAQ